MKNRTGLFILFGLGMILLSFSLSDRLSETLEEKLKTYRRERQPAILYAHIDRNQYMPGDTIWFKSYLLSGMDSDVLHVRIADHNKKVVMQQQFPMYDIRAHGDVALPDTLSEGKYFFYAYTDRMMNFDPEEVFTQPITISSNISDRVDMELFAMDTSKILRGQEVKVGLRVKDQHMAVKGATGAYSIWVGNEHLKSREIGTNRQGEAYIDFTYPNIADSQSVRFEAKLHGDRQYASLSLQLRHEGNFSKVNIFPESGRLLEGVPNHMVLQVIDDNKNPVVTTLTLKEGDKDIGTVKTNKHGVGNIRFEPKKNVAYRIAFKEDGKTRMVPLTIAKEGYGLRLVKDKGQYVAIVNNQGKPENPTLVLRAFNKIIWSGKITVKSGEAIRAAIPAGDHPREVLSLAIFEPDGAPTVERLFINKPEEKAAYQVHIDTVQQSQGKSHKIKVNLTITDQQGNPVKTNISVAVAEKNTLVASDYRSIRHTFDFHHLPGAGSLTDEDSDADLDLLMISKNWGWYNWRHIVGYTPATSIPIMNNTGGINGRITKMMKRTLKPLQIYLLSKAGVEPVSVNSEGYFSIPPEALMVNPFEGKYLILGPDFYENYELRFLNSAADYDEKIKAGTALDRVRPFNHMARYVPPPVNTFGKGIQLNEVRISALGSVSIRGRGPCANECGDYVCIYKVLNCPIHTGGEKPKVGFIYRFPYKPNIIYHGCGKAPTPAPRDGIPGSPAPPPTSLKLPAISYPNTFFLPDYANVTITEPDMRSTIFWAPNLYTGAEGKTSFEFQKGSLKRDFILMVQGVEVHTLRPVYYSHTLKL